MTHPKQIIHRKNTIKPNPTPLPTTFKKKGGEGGNLTECVAVKDF